MNEAKREEGNMQISGVVVLYNPDHTITNNIKSYLPYLGKLYVVDNSDVKNAKLVSEVKTMENVEYIDNQGNRGIAKALNVAAQRGLDSQAQWLLTMDQDSRFETGAVEKMLSYLESTDVSDIGIVTPLHVIPNKIYNEKEEDSPRQVLTVSTSGNMLNLQVYRNLGPFLEELFIDAVDHEYCLRLNSKGYRVICLPAVKLFHHLGQLKRESILGVKTTVTHHNYIRRYYITRNRLFVASLYQHRYPKWHRRAVVSLWRDIIKIMFAEQDKLRKLRSVLRGIIDYKREIFGKFDDK